MTSQNEPDECPHLKVKRAELAHQLSILERHSKFTTRVRALLSFENGFFRVSVAGSKVGVPAQGVWPGVAQVYADFVFRIGLAYPHHEELNLKIQNDDFYVEEWHTDTVWQPPNQDTVKLPLDATPEMVAGLYRQFNQEEIDRSGLSILVNEEADTRKAAVEEAAKKLELYKASILLLPLSARRQLFDLPDELAAKIDIQFYTDVRDALMKEPSD